MVCQVDSSEPSPEPKARALLSTPPWTPRALERPTEPLARHLASHASRQSWSSPAFLKRKHIEANPLFDSTLDPILGDAAVADERSKKAKFGRLSDQWHFVERTPRPEKDGADSDEAAVAEEEPSVAGEPPTPAPDHSTSPVVQLAYPPPTSEAVRSGAPVSPESSAGIHAPSLPVVPAAAAEAEKPSAPSSPAAAPLALTPPAPASPAPVPLEFSQPSPQAEHQNQAAAALVDLTEPKDSETIDVTIPQTSPDWQLPSPGFLSNFLGKYSDGLSEQSRGLAPGGEVQYPMLPDSIVGNDAAKFNSGLIPQASKPDGLDLGYASFSEGPHATALPVSQQTALPWPPFQTLVEPEVSSAGRNQLVDETVRALMVVREEDPSKAELEESHEQDLTASNEAADAFHEGEDSGAAGLYRPCEDQDDARRNASHSEFLEYIDQVTHQQPTTHDDGTEGVSYTQQDILQNQEELARSGQMGEKSHPTGASQTKPIEIIEIDSDEESESVSCEESGPEAVDVSQYVELLEEEDFSGEGEEDGEEVDGGEDERASAYDARSELGRSRSPEKEELKVEETRVQETFEEYEVVGADEQEVSIDSLQNRHTLIQVDGRLQETHTTSTLSFRRSEGISIPLTPRPSGLEETDVPTALSQDMPLTSHEDRSPPTAHDRTLQLETPRATQNNDAVFEHPGLVDKSADSQEVNPMDESGPFQMNKEAISQQVDFSQLLNGSSIQRPESLPIKSLQSVPLTTGNAMGTRPLDDLQPELPAPRSPTLPPPPHIRRHPGLTSPPPTLLIPATEALAHAAPAPPEHPATSASPTREPAPAPSSPTSLATPSPPAIRGIRTSISYYAPLSSLAEHFSTTIDVIAVVAHATAPQRAPRGARDYHCSMYLLDPGLVASAPENPSMVSAQVFRRQPSVLPVVRTGDVVLLREFKVVPESAKTGLLSTKSSAWAVFKSGAGGEGGPAEMRGAPVEFGDEELEVVKGLREWWDELDTGLRGRLAARMVKGQKGEGKVKESQSDLGQENNKENQAVAAGKAVEREGPSSPVLELEHKLRNGRVYTDRPQSSRGEEKLSVHELRDGRTYRD